jgi:hypothetical protein
MPTPSPAAPTSVAVPTRNASDDRPTPSSRIRLVIVLLCAAATSAIALSDAIVQGVTGHSVLPSDDTSPTIMLVSLIHGATYAALCWVLTAEAHRIDAGHRVVRWVRRGLIADLAVMSALFSVGIPLSTSIFALKNNQMANDIISSAGGSTFLAMFALAFAVGVGTVRRAALRPAPYLLIAILPALGLMIGLAALGSGFAHPGYAETLVNFGVGLIALRRRTD